jgi:hypothetical protein
MTIAIVSDVTARRLMHRFHHTTVILVDFSSWKAGSATLAVLLEHLELLLLSQDYVLLLTVETCLKGTVRRKPRWVKSGINR